ncbi:PI-PLC X domain-containing protein 2 [Paramormyrops kingsleyae]|uniref:PI-PLC X domain-containing protein 2 n=1 Tax=Paramormyrops kingsleyae TaxID=1676925 RepID=UPI003B971073
MKKWSMTQNLSFLKQLEAGICYFNLRVSSKPDEPGYEVYFIHALFGHRVQDGLSDIERLLGEHPKEVVLLDFNHHYAMSEEHHRHLLATLYEVFGRKLCKVSAVEEITLDYLWENDYQMYIRKYFERLREKQESGRGADAEGACMIKTGGALQVLVFYHHPSAETCTLLWPGSKIPAPWANTTDPHKLLQFLESTRAERVHCGSFHVSQAILTPRVKTVIGGLLRGLRKHLVERNLPTIMTWVKAQKPGRQGVNIITLDFVDLVDFASSVIKLNDHLLPDQAVT